MNEMLKKQTKKNMFFLNTFFQKSVLILYWLFFPSVTGTHQNERVNINKWRQIKNKILKRKMKVNLDWLIPLEINDDKCFPTYRWQPWYALIFPPSISAAPTGATRGAPVLPSAQQMAAEAKGRKSFKHSYF